MASIILTFGLAGSLAAQTTITTYKGRAFAASVKAAVVGPVFVSDTGELAPSGDCRNAALLSTSVANVLSADVAAASTRAASGKANSSASLAELHILAGHPCQVTAGFVQAEAEASASGVNGSSEIAELTFGGQKITVTGQTNQTCLIPGATLIINEQKKGMIGNNREIRVNALHLIVPALGVDVTVCSARSGLVVQIDVKSCMERLNLPRRRASWLLHRLTEQCQLQPHGERRWRYYTPL